MHVTVVEMTVFTATCFAAPCRRSVIQYIVVLATCGIVTAQGREVLQEFLESTAATEKFIRSVDEKLTESTQKYESK